MFLSIAYLDIVKYINGTSIISIHKDFSATWKLLMVGTENCLRLKHCIDALKQDCFQVKKKLLMGFHELVICSSNLPIIFWCDPVAWIHCCSQTLWDTRYKKNWLAQHIKPGHIDNHNLSQPLGQSWTDKNTLLWECWVECTVTTDFEIVLVKYMSYPRSWGCLSCRILGGEGVLTKFLGGRD